MPFSPGEQEYYWCNKHQMKLDNFNWPCNDHTKYVSNPVNYEIIQDDEKPIKSFHHTDTGNAERLVYYHGKNIHYCPEWNRWLIWDGRRWKVDDDKGTRINRLAKQAILNIYSELKIAASEDEERAIKRWAKTSESSQGRQAMIKLAQSELGVSVTPDDLDANSWLFNAWSGTIDLKTGEQKTHDRADLITKISYVEYRHETNIEPFNFFLDKIMAGDQELIGYLKRACGSSLCGVNAECLFILYGTGKNGKSTLLNIIRQVIDEYAMNTQPETLLLKRSGGIPNDVARLKGQRFVTSIEIEDGRRLAESLIKQLTGGDPVTARFMRGEFFDFVPSFKLFLATNHKPLIRGGDLAIWSRIHLIPFMVFIKPEERDPYLVEKMRGIFSGILAWLVEGCLEWQKIGLNPPKKVVDATDDYQRDMDSLGNYLEEDTIDKPDGMTKASEIYGRYKHWAQENNAFVLSEKLFSMRMQDKGYQKKKSNGIWYLGLEFKSGTLGRVSLISHVEEVYSSNIEKPFQPSHSVDEDMSVTAERRKTLLNAVHEIAKLNRETGIDYGAPLPAILDAMKDKGYQSGVEADLKIMKEIGELMEHPNKPGFYEATS